ncbi:uncharacterized protein LOC112192337 isoform X2 [Rosa chinensis]|uniref:uncharacterized protein LOC112192337 isoform X2 n=1 Tax=Rosa chinensis TaxID=74649 RepID=UPI001AD8E140|nr:uncharacterized protein LOC112192337 isoform X2 [Rosa chinensis]
MIRRAACLALRKFLSSPPPAPSPVTGGVLGLSIKAGISTDIIAPGTGVCYTFAHMLGELSFRPQLSSIVREMISDLGDDVVDSMLSGACFGSLDPSMLTVSGIRLMIARTYCSAPMQLSLLQQYRGLLLYYSAVNVGEHAYEDDSFLSEIHKIRTVSDIVFIVMHPRLHFANKSVKFITSAVLMLQYANIRFQHVHHNVIHRRVSWGKAFQCFHVGQIDLPALINGIENQAMRDSLLEGIKYFNGQAPDLGGLRVNSPTIAATVFHNYYKHLFTSRVIHNVGDSCAVVHDLLPQIPTYLWEFIKFQHTKSLFPLLDLKMLVKLRCSLRIWSLLTALQNANRGPLYMIYSLVDFRKI